MPTAIRTPPEFTRRTSSESGRTLSSELARAHAELGTVLAECGFVLDTEAWFERSSPGEADFFVAVELGEGEAAAVLVEHSGAWSWWFEAERPVPRPSRTAFILARTSLAESGRHQDDVHVRVLRFTSPPPAVVSAQWIDRNVVTELIEFPSAAPQNGDAAEAQKPAIAPASLGLLASQQRKPRILVFMHGALDATLPAFALSWLQPDEVTSDAPSAFVGFDHRTLSVEPVLNARELLSALSSVAWQEPPTIDFLCDGRGGLVARAFAEAVADQANRTVEVGRIRVRFSRASSTATELINLHTNVLVGNARFAAHLVPEAPTLTFLRRGFRAFAEYLKAVASGVLRRDGAIGLGALVSDDELLNLVRSGDSTAGRVELKVEYLESYCDFIPVFVNGLLDRIDLVSHPANRPLVHATVGEPFRLEEAHHQSLRTVPGWRALYEDLNVSHATNYAFAARSSLQRRPRSPVEIHAAAELPKELVLGQPSPLEVRVSPEALSVAADRASATGMMQTNPDLKLAVQVYGRKNVRIQGQSLIEIDVPNEEISLHFAALGTHAGDGRVEVILRQGPMPLLVLKLDVQVVAAAKRDFAVTTKASGQGALEPSGNDPEHRLTILEQEHGSKTSFQFVLHSPLVSETIHVESKPLSADTAHYVADLYQEIESARILNQDDALAFQGVLRAIGGRLLDELFPPELQRVLYEHHEEWGHIFVMSTEPFIPWELVVLKDPDSPTVHDSSPFLAELGLVRWLHNRKRPPESFALPPGSAFHVCPSYPEEQDRLDQAQAEAAEIAAILGSQAVPPHPREVMQQLKRGGTVALFHFAGHGHADSEHAHHSKLMLEGRRVAREYVREHLPAIWVEQTADVGRYGKPRAVVVLNACRTGRLTPHLTSAGGFADAFLKAGAGVFISAHWAVGDLPARNFVTSLYREWVKPGTTLRVAVASARAAAREAGEATWLAYVVYGHPDATLTLDTN